MNAYNFALHTKKTQSKNYDKKLHNDFLPFALTIYI